MSLRRVLCLGALTLPLLAAADGSVIEATTASGEAVRLLPNGRWEYVDAARQADAHRIAESYPENHLRPQAAQGGLFGLGRYVMPGDPEYNRGSLSGKGR